MTTKILLFLLTENRKLPTETFLDLKKNIAKL